MATFTHFGDKSIEYTNQSTIIFKQNLVTFRKILRQTLVTVRREELRKDVTFSVKLHLLRNILTVN